VPIVLLSALDEAHVRRLFDASDADGWICKPLTREKLHAAAGRFLAKAPATPAAADVRWLHATEESDRYRVLVVEDEAPIASRIESALGATCEVTTVGEGNAAIEHLLHGRYECVLLDLMLPRLSGFDVLRHLMLRRPQILKSTIIMTAATDESLQFIDPSSVAGILHKPFPADMLEGLVARVARTAE
jgi:DNA-binding response OmpR family regulator